MWAITGHGALIVLLTLLTQLGGIAWAIALAFRRRRWLAFAAIYAALSISAVFVAPVFGRVALPCSSDTEITMQSPIYCALNRQYVTPELRVVVLDLSSHLAEAYPGTVTQVLDANFPFLNGFPLLPHLSHNDGRKVDLAFYYGDGQRYLPGVTRSPIGYFAFEDGPTDCPSRWLTLRWNMGWLQGLWMDAHLHGPHMVAALDWLSQDVRVTKVFVEPHLQRSLGVSDDKIRFQGCRAARHDDHIHIQI